MKILVIDDEPLVRRSLTRALSQRKHEIFEAVDGLAGLETWKKVDPDLVFVDVLMPGLKGPELIKMMSGHRAKVILMTAFSGEEIVSEHDLPIDLFLKKPFEDIFEIVLRAEELLK
jgi:DNA-binding response OmpR family regulator